MKIRFFFTIFIVLAVTAAAISTLYFYFFNEERFRLIDHRIETGASILISSDLSLDLLEDLEEADEMVHEVFGDERLNQVVVISDSLGKNLYRSKNAILLPPGPLALTPQWHTLEHDNHVIRLLTIPWPQRKLILQVGVILDQELLHWRATSWTLVLYSAIILIVVFVVSIFLSRLLLLPLQKLSAYLRHLASPFESASKMPPLPQLPGLMSNGFSFLSARDEFIQLTLAAKDLSEKIQNSANLTQSGSAQMAHEIKTPLTVIRNSIESAIENKNNQAEQKSNLSEALTELDHLGQVVEDFLSWARTESAPTASFELHAIDLTPTVQSIVDKWNRLEGNRILFEAQENLKIFAKPSFVNQVLSNLLSNALKYSTPQSFIKVALKHQTLTVSNEGPHIAERVLAKLGRPFNASDLGGFKGTGLGLAWVSSICRKYSWRFEIKNVSGGVSAEVHFSNEG